MKNFIKQFSDWTMFEKIWIVTMTILLVVSSIAMHDTVLGIITTLTGMLCVVMVAKGNIWNYFWGVINVTLYAYICYHANYSGDFILNAFFYLPMQFVGLLMWKKNYDSTEDVVKAKEFDLKKWIITIIVLVVGTVAFAKGMPLVNKMLGMDANPLPYIDSFTTVASIAAMILMVKRYAEQWVLWIVINGLSIIMWLNLKDSAMVIMFLAYEINSVYGYLNWRKIYNIQKRS